MTYQEYLDKHYFPTQKAIWDNVTNSVNLDVDGHVHGNAWQQILKMRNRVSSNIWVVRGQVENSLKAT